jgi:cation-transporting P-type ATPase E
MTLAQEGLTAANVAERVAAGQVNVVEHRSSRDVGSILRENIFTRFNALIGALCALMLVVGEYQDALFGFAIVANTGIGIIQELRAKRTLDSLTVVGRGRPTVRRDGVDMAVDQEDVVIDDLVVLASGDALVVDGELTAADGLEVDESLLTGESDPVLKKPGDRVLSGSFVVAGAGLAHTVAVGSDAYASKLAEEAGRFALSRSDLMSGINSFLRVIQWLLIPAAALLIISQLNADESLPDAIAGAVAGTVTMIPEGLVLLTSVAFATGVIRLGRRQTLVQELAAVEGLARVDVVCTDKTGTLTEDRMMLRDVDVLEPALPVREALGALAGAEANPNASMRAIAADAAAPDGWMVTETVPFSSARKWSGARFADQGWWVLGAPDMLLQAGDPALLSADRRAGEGLRVLLLGRVSDTSTGFLDGAPAPGAVEPAALLMLSQQLRPDAAETLAYFARQGVTVKIVSGDNPTTVGAVGSALGLPGASETVDARHLPDSQTELAAELETHNVFGRVSPQQKRAMVSALQSRGHVVAMTGDGVNDTLALKDADIGVAMGSGSAAARAVAQIVLLDNRFSSLPYVVAEGRRVLANVERVANLFLTKTFYALTLALLVGVAGLPFPFLPRHLTLIGTLTIGVPAFFLALAPSSERARPGFVRRVLRFAIPAGLVAAGASFTSYALARANAESPLVEDRTTAAITLFLVAWFVLLLVARPLVRWKLALLAVMASGFVLALYVPFLQDFFALQPTNVENNLTGVAIATGSCAVLLVLLRLTAAIPGHAPVVSETASRDQLSSSRA